MKKELIIQQFDNKKIIILGFGKEGMSSYRFIRRYFPKLPIWIADKNEGLEIAAYQNDPFVTFILGSKYDQNLLDFDLILKTPGVNLNHLNYFIPSHKITSQTALFLSAFGDQTIGITGTKGKSTTASLICHIFKNEGKPVLLSGNIGIPFFDIVEQITEETTVVAELSAHQLEFLSHSPHIAILLNLYQEHLDHFNSFNNYQLAKLNITEFQKKKDFFIFNADDVHIQALLKSHRYERNVLPFSRKRILSYGAYSYEQQIVIANNKEELAHYELSHFDNLPGRHNYYNIMAAILACRTKELPDASILKHLKTYRGLPHRIEFVGTFQEVLFYNDSISTIPEATIAALKALRKVDTLILGGYDRGIDYKLIINHLQEEPVTNVIFTGPAGRRIYEEWKMNYPLPENFILENDFYEIVLFAFKNTQKNKICLLSPAAASYDQFKDFTERGNTFKALIKKVVSYKS